MHKYGVKLHFFRLLIKKVFCTKYNYFEGMIVKALIVVV